jgi:hypothetical protein
MKNLLTILFLFTVSFSFAQNVIKEDSIPEPIYDTTYRITITSKNSFYFCSKKFRLPKDTVINHLGYTSRFESDITKWKGEYNRMTGSGFVDCGRGYLSWEYFKTIEGAKVEFNGYPDQIKRQMKDFKKEKIKLWVCNQEVEAIKINYTPFQGKKSTMIIFYGTINGHNVFGDLTYHRKEINASEDLAPLFKQIMKF